MTPSVGLYIIIHTSAMATGVATMGRRKIDAHHPLAPERPVQQERERDAEHELKRRGERGEVHGQPQRVPKALVVDEGAPEIGEPHELRARQARGVPGVHAHVEREGDGKDHQDGDDRDGGQGEDRHRVALDESRPPGAGRSQREATSSRSRP